MFKLRTFKVIRLYSTIKAPKLNSKVTKIWVFDDGNPPTQVSTNGCVNVDDFIDKIRGKFNIHSRLTLHPSINASHFEPRLKLNQIATLQNSYKSPFFVKAIPNISHSAIKKTIFIRQDDDKGNFTDEYYQYTINREFDLAQITKNGEGLVHLSQPKIIVSFDGLEDGEKYQLHRYQQNFAGWSKNEANGWSIVFLILSIGNLTVVLYSYGGGVEAGYDSQS
jgi:hypothetical protein